MHVHMRRKVEVFPFGDRIWCKLGRACGRFTVDVGSEGKGLEGLSGNHEWIFGDADTK